MTHVARSGVELVGDAVASVVTTPALDKRELREAPLVDQIEAVLYQDMLCNWFPRVIDERGGYLQNFDRAWRPTGDGWKSLIYQCRITWTAARFAQYAPEHAAAFGAHALHGVAFVDRALRDRVHGSFFFSIDADGSPFRDGEKHVLVPSYAIFALARVHAATGDPRALALAQAELAWLESHLRDEQGGGYHEAFGRDGRPILAPDTPPGRDLLWRRYGTKTLSAQIHAMEALTELHAVAPQPAVRERIRALHRLIVDGAVTPQDDLLAELSAPSTKPTYLASGGYMMETACFLIEAARELGDAADPSTWRIARRLVDRVLERHWDTRVGGVWAQSSRAARSRRDDAGTHAKVWWAQAESLHALALMDARYGAETERYTDALRAQWRFVLDHLIDARYGGWYRQTDADGRVLGTRAKAQSWQACYHTGRALMNVATLLRSKESRPTAMTDGSA